MLKQCNNMSSHQNNKFKSDYWFTPLNILCKLGQFTLDPCTSIYRPWRTAIKHYCIEEVDGLHENWFGRVWLNPPYGSRLIDWLMKMANHGNGIALTFARTDTKAFQKYVFPFADSLLFIGGRLTFCNTAGLKARGNGGAPSVLISYDTTSSFYLKNSAIKGFFNPIKYGR